MALLSSSKHQSLIDTMKGIMSFDPGRSQEGGLLSQAGGLGLSLLQSRLQL